jgi:mono/diheme cytochrome c family protein
VQIFEVGQAGGRPFYSMEYIAGGSLADRLARGPYTPHQAAELLESLARTVHAAHEHGIVHRDLKPSNVMMAHDGTPKIADFGLAKRLNDDSGHTNTGEILGTPSYMAPEQAEGKKDQIGPATDVYALGAILYEMLAGQPPFAGITPLEALQRVVHQEPAAPSRFATPVPRDLEAICLKCLEKSPHRRYVSAQALADDLRRFLTGQPVTARHAGPLVRSWKWMRRHPQVVGLAVLIALIAMIPIYYVADAYQAEREVRLRAQARAPLVREILQRNCYECHGQNPKDIQKNFDILNFQQLLDERRRVVVPGAPDNSRLIQRIVDGSMPPEKEEVRLPRVSEIELTILREWIQGGAPPLPEPAPDAEIVSAVPYSKVADETRAIFKKKCYDCHNHKLAERGVKILQHRLLVNVHKEVIPGDPDGSRLFQLVTSDDDDVRMPKAPEDPLTKEEINTIRRWIMAGAPPFPKGR